MSKLVVIVGATGGQGGSVVSSFLEDKTFKVRGITRNPESQKAKALAARGVEVVRADLNDESSLVKAFGGAHTIFAVTDFFEPFTAKGPQYAMEVEYAQGTNLAKAAAKTTSLEHYIWSTLPDSKALSNGKWVVPHFDGKARVDEFIKQDKALLAKTTFLWITFYATNLFYPSFAPFYIKTANKYILLAPVNPEITPLASVGDPNTNVGIFVYAVATNRPAGGSYVKGSVETYSDLSSYLATWGRASGLAAAPDSTMVMQSSLEQFDAMWAGWGMEMGLMLKFWEEAKEKSWTAADGSTVVPIQELLSPEAKKKVVDTATAFKALDWSAL